MLRKGFWTLYNIQRNTFSWQPFRRRRKDPISNRTDTAKLVFYGIFTQKVTGEHKGTLKIPYIELNNGTDLTLGNLDVSDTLKLTDGNTITSSENMLMLTQDNTAVEPACERFNSFVEGTMQWSFVKTKSEKRFPIEKNQRHRPLSLNKKYFGNMAGRIHGQDCAWCTFYQPSNAAYPYEYSGH